MDPYLKFTNQFAILKFLRIIRQIVFLIVAIILVSCEKEPSVDMVIVSPSSATIEVGGTTQLEATIIDASGNILKDRIISWSSDNANTADVSSSGSVTGESEGGPVKITATCEGKSSTAQITVIPPRIASLTISTSSMTIEVGESKQIVTTLKDSYNNVLTGRTITWSSSNGEVATVTSSGIVTGKSVGGPVTITVNCEGQSSTAQVTVTQASVASVLITPSSADIIIGKKLQFSAVALDGRGVILGDRTIVWSSSNTEIATISSSGLVTGLRSGSINIVATSEGKDGAAQLSVKIPSGVPSGVGFMYDWLTSHITWAIGYNQSLLERNSHVATQIQAKIDMLQRPNLVNEIIDGSFYAAENTTSIDGRNITISAVFPLDEMRSDANQSVISIKLAIPILEDFMGTSYPADAFYDWYGFCMGNTNGGNSIEMEDRATYESRTEPDRLLYENILYHELSHIYIGSEVLTHFLATYLYNVINTGTTSIQSWIYFEWPYAPLESTNSYLHALLDIYLLIGHDNMSNAYKILYSLNPPYGSPLSDECLQVFIDQAPAAVKDQVAAKVAKINP